MKIIYFLFPFLLLLSLIKSDYAFIDVMSSDIKLTSYNSTIYQPSIKRLSEYDQIYRFSGKVCSEQNLTKILENCFIKYINYNSHWILLAHTEELIEALIHVKENSTFVNYDIQAIIYNNDTISKLKVFTDYKTPLYSLSNTEYIELLKYDINKEKENIFLNLYYVHMQTSSQSLLLLLTTISISVMLLTFSIIWHVLLFKVHTNQNLPLQKCSISYIYMKTIVSIFVIYYVYLAVQPFDITDFAASMSKYYIKIVVTTLNSVMSAIFWFALCIVAYGWMIYRTVLTNSEKRKFLLLFLVLYVILLFDKLFVVLDFFEIMNVNNLN